jgi:hypothetical protein
MFSKLSKWAISISNLTLVFANTHLNPNYSIYNTYLKQYIITYFRVLHFMMFQCFHHFHKQHLWVFTRSANHIEWSFMNFHPIRSLSESISWVKILLSMWIYLIWCL